MSSCKVVILNWNGTAHLRLFLPSVVATTPPHVPIVVADNGSDDESCSFLRDNFPGVEIVQLDRNYGFAEGYNRALAQIEADYFLLLNSDVETTPGWIEPLIEAMDAADDMAAVAPKLLSYSDKSMFEYAGASGGFIDALGYPFCRGRILSHVESDCGQYDMPRDVFWASGACIMFRSSVFRELGGFDARFFAHMEEIDLCWRAQLYGYRVAVEPRSTVYHLGGGTLPNNSPRKIYLNFRNNLAMLYKNLPTKRLWPILLVRMTLDGCSAMVYLLRGRTDFFRSVVHAHRDFRKMKDYLREERKKIAEHTRRQPRYIYRSSIILRYIFVSKRFGRLL